MLFLGIDIGSSSVKLAVLDGESGKSIATAQYPQTEFEITSPKPGWAEQDPEMWWQAVIHCCQQLSTQIPLHRVKAIGIAYQMHGLVLVDKDYQPIRPAIIWCDSRAVSIGEEAFNTLGADYCSQHLLNSPGNFTAAKLRWVQENEPQSFSNIHKIMLPGDYIALKLSGSVSTTTGGLSEATLWDFKEHRIASELLKHWHLDSDLLPPLTPNLGEQVKLSSEAANHLGLKTGTPVTYRAGDQPNNAFSLNVLQPGEIAATAGTSGVIYGVTDNNCYDKQSRVNTFLHVNDNSPDTTRNGVLLCLNGAGRSYAWLRQILAQAGASLNYKQLNKIVNASPAGSNGLMFHPFGNGAERLLGNQNPGASFSGLDFNRHGIEHMARATLEGIVYAISYGMDTLQQQGLHATIVRAGRANLFLSEVFTQIFASVINTSVELYQTDGAEGAARGAALGNHFYASTTETFLGLEKQQRIDPQHELQEIYQSIIQQWKRSLPL